MISDYLGAGELADLVGCKPNQRSLMIKWLEANYWRFVINRKGEPLVARAYHDKKMGIYEDEKSSQEEKYTETPNLRAFMP